MMPGIPAHVNIKFAAVAATRLLAASKASAIFACMSAAAGVFGAGLGDMQPNREQRTTTGSNIEHNARHTEQNDDIGFLTR